jgi:hypothetical protein
MRGQAMEDRWHRGQSSMTPFFPTDVKHDEVSDAASAFTSTRNISKLIVACA